MSEVSSSDAISYRDDWPDMHPLETRTMSTTSERDCGWVAKMKGITFAQITNLNCDQERAI